MSKFTKTVSTLVAAKFRTCILHIGSDKTGTSSLQRSFHRGRKQLAELGYHYPGQSEDHIFLASTFHQTPEAIPFHARFGRTGPASIQAYNEREMVIFDSELKTVQAHTLVLSNEYIADLSWECCVKLRDYLHSLAETITVICYVRHPIDHAVSRAQQNLKVGLETWGNLSLSYFSPQSVLPKFVSVFGRQNVNVRPFDRDQLHGQSVVSDFANAIGICDPDIRKIPEKKVNGSISLEAAAIANALTTQQPRQRGKIWNPDRAQTVWFGAMPGTRFGLKADQLAELQKLSATELRYLKEEFGIDLPAPDVELLTASEPNWSEDTITGIARLINQLNKRNEKLESDLRYKEALLALSEQDDARACELLSSAITLNQTHVEAARELIAIWSKQGKNDQALALIDEFERREISRELLATQAS